MMEMESTHKILVKILSEKKRLRDIHIDERIILKCILRKYSVRFWAGFIWLRIRSSGGVL
jgi:hypothetical protein